MKKIIQLCSFVIAALLVTSCSSFRVNMSQRYGAHYPPTPAPSGSEWVDVANWQSFLVSHGFLASGQYSVNTFDAATVAATKKFQITPGKVAQYVLPATGCVNFATFHKAVDEGMPMYKVVRGQDLCTGQHKHPLDDGSGTSDTFHDKYLHSGCTGVDVGDWQRFLVANGFLAMSNYTLNQFGSTTKTATMAFQNAFKANHLVATGQVDPVTYAFARSQTLLNLGGALVMSSDGVTPPLESQTDCSGN